MEVDYPDFTVQDELSSVTLIIESHKLYVHREVLAAWSPVFKAMFTRDFKEKEMSEIELPDKKLDDFVELLYCMYPPIKSVSGECLCLFILLGVWLTLPKFKLCGRLGVHLPTLIL